MNITKIDVNTFGGILLTWISYFLGGFDTALVTLLGVMALDYITGICKGFYNKKLNSHIVLKGIIKNILYLVIVSLSVYIDKIMGDSGAIRTLVIYFFVANEGLSIIENAVSMGLPLPQKLIDALEQLKGENE